MKNKVLIFDKSQNLISNKIEKMEKFLLERGLFGFSFLTTSDLGVFKFCLTGAKEDGGTIVVFCDNDKLDECVEDVKKGADLMSLLDEQAIRLDNEAENLKMLFVPFEIDFEKFLDEFLPRQNVFVYSIFGKSKNFVKDRFDEYKSEFNTSYEIITKHPFLHTVYSSWEIPDGKLKQDFADCLYSQKNETLGEKLNSYLSETGKNLQVFDLGSKGRLAAELDCDVRVLRSIQDLRNLGISKELPDDENTNKEVVLALSKRALLNPKNDVVMAVCDKLGSSGKSYVCVGNTKLLNLYSSVFVEDERQRLDALSDFAIFRLMCFLKGQE